jgi:ABC-2 type transport system ATP-binding protein
MLLIMQTSEKGKYAVTGRGVTKSFDGLLVLQNMSVNIPRGVTYCLLGPNGSGKTTLIRAIVGLVHLDKGEICVLGEPVSKVQEVYLRIGYMTQHRALYPDLTVQENMEFFAGLYGILGKKRSERISELLEMVNLEEHRVRLAGDLSGGMYQRLSLACTLIHEPDLLLLDEPTVGIDPKLRQTFWDYFNQLAEGGATVLITTHLLDEAERCKVVGYMNRGNIEAEGSPEEIKHNAGLRTVLRLLVDDPKATVSKLRELGFEARVKGEELDVPLESHRQMKEVLDAANPKDLRLIEPTMEEAFLKLSEGRT